MPAADVPATCVEGTDVVEAPALLVRVALATAVLGVVVTGVLVLLSGEDVALTVLVDVGTGVFVPSAVDASPSAAAVSHVGVACGDWVA